MSNPNGDISVSIKAISCTFVLWIPWNIMLKKFGTDPSPDDLINTGTIAG
jgi:hypothetical protein